MSSNRCIGKNGKIPWHHKEDFQWFKEFTIGKNIVIGRNTYDKLPILKNRIIWVLSKTEKEGAGALCDISTMYHYTSNINIIPKDAIVAGGKSIYELFMPQITEFYVTVIDKEYEGDTYMSAFEHNFSTQEVIKVFDFGKIIKYTR